MARLYNKLPSELIGLEDEYDSYCFNEACAFIIGKLEKKEEPNFNVHECERSYSKASDMYEELRQSGVEVK